MFQPMIGKAARSARRLFPREARSDGPLVLHRSNNGEFPVDAREWLVTRTLASTELIDSLFSSDGRWAMTRHQDLDLLKLNLSSARLQLDQVFSPLYEAVSYSLDGVDPLGFNRHDRQHIVNVDRVSQSLLDQARQSWNQFVTENQVLPKITDKTKLRTLIAAWGHDIGNLFSRGSHAFISPRMLLDIFPLLKSDSKQWRIIRRAMQLHHETFAKHLLHTTLNGRESTARTNQILEVFRRHFGPEALALIIADKVDVGRHRISDKIKDPRAIEDPHLETNLLGQTEKLTLSDDELTLTWKLTFDMRMGESDQRLWHLSRSRAHSPGRKAIVSELTHQRFDDPKLPLTYFDIWRSRFWSLYFERNTLAVWAMFALFPKLESVRLEFFDPEINQYASIELNKKFLASDFRRLERVMLSSAVNR